jgi:zinc-binding alcohol dehydrogenase family protein
MMRAVAYRANLAVSDPESLVDIEVPIPEPGPRDLLVQVEAVSVNPVDVKRRQGIDPQGQPRILGFDAAGVVCEVGREVTGFVAGDEVYYAGSISRPGTNAQFHLVDERIAGHKPTSLSFAEAAALPLCTITAWEALFDRFRLQAGSTGTLLVLAAAGGVGSMVVQLARALTDITVVGTASRPESHRFALDLGAHHVVDHRSLVRDVRAVEPRGVRYIVSSHSVGNIEAFADILVPGGEITAIDEPEGLDLLPLKAKSITWHWELMFTRALFETDDMSAQHDLLEEVRRLVDTGAVRTTLTTQLGPINAASIREAHALVEGGHTVGKVVVAGF